MPVDEDFYFAGDLSEAGDDRTKLDHLERRLEVYLADMRAEAARLRTVRRSWAQATFSQSVAHNTNTVPTLTVQYDRPGWGVSSTNRIIPDVAGYYLATVQCTMTLGAGGRMISGALRNNGGTPPGMTDGSSGGGSPNQSSSSSFILLNGTTDWVNVFLYQFQPAGTAAATMTGTLSLYLVDFFENV